MSSRAHKEAEFAYGAGQVNPTKAISPGLVYDMDAMSYVQFLCHEGYNGSSIGSLVGQGQINCSKLVPANGEDAINYPSMLLTLRSRQEPTVGVFRRRVMNVGAPQSVYNATIKAPAGVEIMVKPMTLTFSRALQKRSFKVVVKAKAMTDDAVVVSGSLTWRSSRYTVRSPVAVYNPWSH